MTPITAEQQVNNKEKSQALLSSTELAKTLFPNDEWICTEPNIWVAQSRLSQEKREPEKWQKEMAQVRILTSRGSIAYFLPDKYIKGKIGSKTADLVLDGEVVEMKTISGGRETLGGKFKYGYNQGALLLKNCEITKKHSVFIRLLSDLPIRSVKAKIAGELKNRFDEGKFICFFETIGELHSWTYNELRSIIGT
ncbi:MAG: hypothetical protein FWB86_14090 [Treponema sp.]|nr:hypothetical protein [Treponema sp.]